MEEERVKVFLEGLLRFRDWEEDRISNTYQFGQPQQNQKEQSQVLLRGYEYIQFKNLKDPSAVSLFKVTECS